MTFKEIRRCLDGAVIPFGGKISKGLKASPAVVEIAPGWQALGFSTSSVERASGQHARHLLAVVEEASGVDDWVVLDVVLSNSAGLPEAAEAIHRLALKWNETATWVRPSFKLNDN